MSSQFHPRSIGPILILALGLSRPVAATEEPRSILVLVVNQAQVASDVVAEARRDVIRIYAEIDVRVIWAKDVTAGAAYPLVIVIAPTGPGVTPDTLGLAMRGANDSPRVAYVFYDRVQQVARRYQTSDGSVLGVAIAHEIGHLLLPYGSHSSSGLMKAVWDNRQFFLARGGLLRFTAQQAALIRSHLMDVPD